MLKNRLLVGCSLGFVALLSLFWPGVPGAVLFYLLAVSFLAFALLEYGTLTAAAGWPGHPIPSAVAGAFLVTGLLASSTVPVGEAVGALAWLPLEVMLLALYLVVLAVLACREDDLARGLRRFAVAAVGMGVVYGLLSFIPKLYFIRGIEPEGRFLLLYLIAGTKAADIGAYAVGSATAKRPEGNHKMTPRLSPKKSWEGLLGGVGASVLCTVVLTTLMGSLLTLDGVRVLGYGSALFWGVAFALLGLLGDLFESALKRVASVKDSGQLPGFGGILDLVDSLVFVAPVFYAAIHFRIL